MRMKIECLKPKLKNQQGPLECETYVELRDLPVARTVLSRGLDAICRAHREGWGWRGLRDARDVLSLFLADGIQLLYRL